MFMMMHVGMALLVVTLGYFVLLTATKPTTAKGVKAFGKVLSILIYIVAAAMLIGGLMWGSKWHHGMMSKCPMCGQSMSCMEGEAGTQGGMMEKGKMMEKKGEVMQKKGKIMEKKGEKMQKQGDTNTK